MVVVGVGRGLTPRIVSSVEGGVRGCKVVVVGFLAGRARVEAAKRRRRVGRVEMCMVRVGCAIEYMFVGIMCLEGLVGMCTERWPFFRAQTVLL